MNNNDHDLKNAFAELRRADSARAPDFESVRKQLGPRRRLFPARFLVLAAAAGLAILFAVSRFGDGGNDRPTDVVRLDLARAKWVSPTDFLLDTPNSDLLRTVPRLWSQPAAPPARGSTLENNQG